LRLTLADQKTLKMLSDQPACGWPSKASSKAFGAIAGLEFHAERAQDVDPPARSRLPVLLILAHGSGNLAVDQPVSASNIVVVSAAARALGHECADMFDGRKGAHAARSCCGSHCDVNEGSWVGRVNRLQKTAKRGSYVHNMWWDCHITTARSCANQQAVKHARSISQRRATRVEDDLDCTWTEVERRRVCAAWRGCRPCRANEDEGRAKRFCTRALHRLPSGPLKATNECARTATWPMMAMSGERV